MNAEILKMIDLYVEEGDFFGEISDRAIAIVETKIGCTFPPQYRAFVKMYGSGGICGVYLSGIEDENHASVINDTEKCRKSGLPHHYLVIEHADEFVYCLNTKHDHHVIRWDDISRKEIIRYATFDEYVQDSFQEAIDNWE